MGFCNCFCRALLCVQNEFSDQNEEERARCVALFVVLVSRDCCVTLRRGAMGLSAVCDCGIS